MTTRRKSPRKAAPARRKVDRARAEQTFVVSAIKRKSLAEDLNERIEVAADAVKNGDAEPAEKLNARVFKFAPDDQRLTEQICQSYADALFDAPPEEDDYFDEWKAEYLNGLLARLRQSAKRGARGAGAKRERARGR